MRFYPRPRTEAEVSAWIDRNIWLYESLGFGFWVIESPNTEFLGYCGIRPLTIENAQEIELGWHTRKEVWSQGIATDAATACRDLAFDRFGIGRLVATIDPAHDASLRVATKVGMRRERETVLDGWPCVIYSIARGSLRPSSGETNDMDDRIIQEQIEYYRRRASEYDVTSSPPGDPLAPFGQEIERALHKFAPRGHVLEVASGTGSWTRLLLEHADHVTALDSAPEMHTESRRKLGDEQRVRYVIADALTWEPDRTYDVFFFANWLSHAGCVQPLLGNRQPLLSTSRTRLPS